MKHNKEVQVERRVHSLGEEFTIKWFPKFGSNGESFAFTFMNEESFLSAAEAMKSALNLYNKAKKNASKEI